MTRLRLLPALLLATVPLGAQQARPAADSGFALTARVPTDAKVKIGRLPNGITYYIRKNLKPEKRAELRLVVNAGSILEKQSQRGYAHFVEHMAFNGTRNFKKNDLVKYLQSIGVRFGADLNAYTSFDETVYILPVPTDTQRIVDQAFTILEDWAHGQIFDTAEAINERGVVLEEWRGGKGAGERMLQQFLPIALKGSLYAERLPIGTDTTILSATAASLKAFYDEWYRPDLMAVVAVGDFDVAMIENKIRTHFSRIRARPNAPKRPIAPVPGNAAPLIAITSDREAVTTDVSVYFKLPAEPTRVVRDYRRDLIGYLYLSMLNDRLSEITQKPNAPFTGAGASKGGFVGRELAPFSLSANVRDGEVEKGLEALLVEARRVDQFGFLASELERAKQDMLRGYERAYAERDKSQSGGFADEYIRVYLEGEATPGIEWEYNAVQKVLPTIALSDVNSLARAWITDSNRVVIVGAPIKDGVALPTVSSILATFDRATRAAVTAYTENVSTDELIPSLRPAGRIVATRALPAGISEWKLSNGARILVKPTDFKADEIRFSASSPGGNAHASDADFMSAAFATQVSNLSGLGSFNRIDLDKRRAGKAANVTVGISEMTEGLGGSASPKDLEFLFQLIYLNFTALRVDTVAFTALAQNAAPYLANRGADPEEVFGDTVQVTLSQRSPRARPLSPAVFAEINPHKAIEFQRNRFADASDFTFAFVGTIDTLVLKPLVEKYIASLPSLGRKDSTTAKSLPAPRGVINKTVRKGVENKATTLMFFSGSCVSTPETRFAFRAMTEAFQIRLTESLREKLGGTYSPSVSGGCSRSPRPEYSISVNFQSSPDNVEALTQATFALIDSLKTHGPTQADVDRVRAEIARAREVELKQNTWWINNMMGRDQAGEDIGGLLAPYDDMVKNLSIAQVRDAARRYLDVTNYARFVLLPENQGAKP
jgi:zinc protease